MNLYFGISAFIFTNKTIFSPIVDFLTFLFLFKFILYQAEHHKLVGVNAEVLQDAQNQR